MIPKQLGELLQEQQEPFILDIYLLEKGCLRNRFNSSLTCRWGSLNPKCLSKKPISKRWKIFPKCSKAVKAVFCKLAFVSDRQKVKKDCGSDIGNNPNSLHKKEDEAKERPHDDTLSSDDISAHGNRKQAIQLPPNEPNCTDYPSKNASTKRVIHLLKQLAFDCLRELTESQKWKNRRKQNLLQFMGPEEIGELLSEDLRIWSKLSGNERNITKLLDVDFSASVGEWRNFEPQMMDVSAEIGDAVFEDISKEIVAEMVALVRPQ